MSLLSAPVPPTLTLSAVAIQLGVEFVKKITKPLKHGRNGFCRAPRHAARTRRWLKKRRCRSQRSLLLREPKRVLLRRQRQRTRPRVNLPVNRQQAANHQSQRPRRSLRQLRRPVVGGRACRTSLPWPGRRAGRMEPLRQRSQRPPSLLPLPSRRQPSLTSRRRPGARPACSGIPRAFWLRHGREQNPVR